MKQELDDKLCKKYPGLYRNRNMDPRFTCMCWGFPGDGWYNLLDELSAILEPLGVIADQVKEKFGGLRFYYHGGKYDDTSKIDAAIQKAEEVAMKTCEICGEPGKVRGGGWMQVRCDKCDEKVILSRKRLPGGGL